MAIFGAGGVGSCAINAAAICGCIPIIAIDVSWTKLELAKAMGATHFINAEEKCPIEEIKGICPDGVDFAIEATGKPYVMSQALYSVRNQGGTAIIVGNARFGDRVHLDPSQFNLGKRVMGTWGGDSQPDRDYPRYARLLKTGRLNIQPLISKTYRLSEINDAIDDLEAGRLARPIIDMAEE
jgi:S-(hydroxymethyl)glutathione dehydrogenase/alcohol dehydrogenase